MSLTSALLGQLERERQNKINPYSAVPISQQLVNIGSSYQKKEPAPTRTSYAPSNNTSSSGTPEQVITELTNNAINRSNENNISDSQISELYQPTLDRLSREEQLLNDTGTAQLGILDREEELAKNQIETNVQDQTELITTQQRQDQQRLASALREAVRGYNALDQQRIARFGASNSAGGAVGEIAQGEFFRAQGNLQGISAENQAKLSQSLVALDKWENDRYDFVDLEFDKQRQSVNQFVQQGLLQINSRRDEVNANKTRDKLNLLKEAKERIDGLNDWKDAQIAKIQLTKAEINEDLAKEIQATQATTSETFDSLGNIAYAPGSRFRDQQRTNVIPNQMSGGNTLYADEDELDSLNANYFLA